MLNLRDLEVSEMFQSRADNPAIEDCPYCNLQLVPEQRIVLSNETCLFLQMPQKVLVGSGVIVPRAHRENLFELTPDEWRDTYDLLQKAKALLDQQYAPDGYNIGWNSGAVAGQHIFHAHLHVIPRFADEPYAGKGIRHWLKQPANRRPSLGQITASGGGPHQSAGHDIHRSPLENPLGGTHQGRRLLPKLGPVHDPRLNPRHNPKHDPRSGPRHDPNG